MPELPEVEVLVRHLRPLIENQLISRVEVRRAKIVRPASVSQFSQRLAGARFIDLARRGKYLLFSLRAARQRAPLLLVGHLGMTGRFLLNAQGDPFPKHAAVILGLGPRNLILEDSRYFGRLTFDSLALERLGPEPSSADFTMDYFYDLLKKTTQPIKVKLLDQSLVAGVGNIYASEILFRAGLPPWRPACRLAHNQVQRLWESLRAVLAEAIDWGSTVPLDWTGTGPKDGLFYYGRAAGAVGNYTEQLAVYDRAGQPCLICGAGIKRMVQAGRSTFYCPRCQR